MNILFITPDMYMGGAGKQLALTASGLINRGHDVYLYTYLGDNLEQCIDNRIKYIPETSVSTNKFLYILQIPFNIRKVVKEYQPDIIIGWRTHAGGYSLIGCFGLKVKIIFSERNDPYKEMTPFLKILSIICCHANGGVFQTEKIRDYFTGLKNSTICSNPINPNTEIPEIYPLEERNNEIAWVGRMVNSHKRMDVAINAFNIIHNKYPNYKLVFWGEGEDRLIAEEWVNNANLKDFVEFKGATNNVVDRLRKARLFLLTSDYEGIPNVVLEAFVAGTPVIATDCNSGGVRVLINNGENGFISKCGDYQDIAKKAILLLSSADLSRLFVDASRKKLDDFNYDRIIDRWNTFINKIVRDV